MAVVKRKKNTRQRAKTSHGFGSMKKNRGAGNRGGRGRSGSGKRGDQKKPRYWKTKRPFGKHGFSSKSRSPEMKTINIKTIEDTMETMIKKGLARQENDTFVLNLADQGYNKLLSTGNSTKKLKITVDYATPKAVEKVSKAGGEVNVLVTKQKKEDADAPGPADAGEEAAPTPKEE
jgi:large subunit ribosomal protein L15